jgi:nitrilase
MIIDPWGDILQEMQLGEGCCTAEIDLDYVKQVRQRMPVAMHRKLS